MAREERIGIHRMTNPATGEELANTVRTEVDDEGIALEIGAALDPAIKARIRFRDPGAGRRERAIEDVKRRVVLNARKRRGDYAVPKPAGGVQAPRYTMVPCPDCEGWGEMERDGRLTMCPRCHGDRMVESTY